MLALVPSSELLGYSQSSAVADWKGQISEFLVRLWIHPRARVNGSAFGVHAPAHALRLALVAPLQLGCYFNPLDERDGQLNMALDRFLRFYPAHAESGPRTPQP